jgi:hypothetical protein
LTHSVRLSALAALDRFRKRNGIWKLAGYITGD